MRIFISGLGLNGKTSILSQYPEDKVVSFSSSKLYKAELDPIEQIEVITKYRADIYSKIADGKLVDRSIIDQLCMYSVLDFKNEHKGEEYHKIINNISDFIKPGDVLILVDGSKNEDLESIFNDNLTISRNSLYNSLEEYKWRTKIFNSAYRILVDTLPIQVKFHEVCIHNWSETYKIKEIIDSYESIPDC